MEAIIDKYLKKLLAGKLNRIPGVTIEPEMSDPNQDKNDDWKWWHPIPSTVTDEEIATLEQALNAPLPASYKRFLQYKHFYELQISECIFCRHPIRSWRDSLDQMIFHGYPRDLLVDTGRIPFADWSDWGLLCFDTTAKTANNNYPIVLWDHEAPDDFETKYADFESMMVELDRAEGGGAGIMGYFKKLLGRFK